MTEIRHATIEYMVHLFHGAKKSNKWSTAIKFCNIKSKCLWNIVMKQVYDKKNWWLWFEYELNILRVS